ncbi:MAG: hypothetical protein ACOC36_00470, partial [Fibrobacterota bacterium]
MKFSRFLFTAVLLCVYFSSAQQSIPPEMLLQLQKQGSADNGISHQLNRFLQNRDLRDSLNLLSPFTRDSLDTLGDSTLSFFPNKDSLKPELSIY